MFTFELARPSQKDLILKWIAQEHIAQWLHGQGLKNLLAGLERFFEGKGDTLHWIGYMDGVPFAYLLSAKEGEDAIAMDLFICEHEYLGKGLAAPMIREFLLTHFADKKEIFIDPEATNARAIHVYEKVGFKTIGEFIAAWHPVPHLQMHLYMKDLKDGTTVGRRTDH